MYGCHDTCATWGCNHAATRWLGALRYCTCCYRRLAPQPCPADVWPPYRPACPDPWPYRRSVYHQRELARL